MATDRSFFINTIPTAPGLSRQDLIKEFNVALSISEKTVIKNMFVKFPFIKTWLSGKQIDFLNNNNQTDMRSISFDELVNVFKLALASKESYVIETIWSNNSLLRDWYNAKKVIAGCDETGEPVYREIAYNDLINIFELALSNQPSIIHSLWNGSSFLKQWISGQKVCVGTDPQGQAVMGTIPFKNLIDISKLILLSGSPEVIKATWEGNSSFRECLRGQNVWVINYDKQGRPVTSLIPFDELLIFFESALTGRALDVVKAMWESNDKLKKWFSGQIVDVDSLPEKQIDKRSISIKDQLHFLKLALLAGEQNLVTTLLSGNALLSKWLNGQKVKLQIHDLPQDYYTMQDELDWFKEVQVRPTSNEHSMPNRELIHFFSLALNTYNMDIINLIWKDNQRLKEMIKVIDVPRGKFLLNQVLNLCKSNNHGFISQYLTTLTDVNMIKEALDDIKKIQNPETSALRSTQIKLLENRLKIEPVKSSTLAIQQQLTPLKGIPVSVPFAIPINSVVQPSNKRIIVIDDDENLEVKRVNKKKKELQTKEEVFITPPDNIPYESPNLFRQQTPAQNDEEVDFFNDENLFHL